METGWKQGEGGPSLFVPALARKSIKRRNRVSIVRARDTRARVYTCIYVCVWLNAHGRRTRAAKGNIHSDRSRQGEKQDSPRLPGLPPRKYKRVSHISRIN